METTGQQIFKRLSGQVANVGGAISGVKHGIEDMKKEADNAKKSAYEQKYNEARLANMQAKTDYTKARTESLMSKQELMRDRALQSGQNEINSKLEQNTGFQDREAMINNQTETTQIEGGNK